MKKNMNMKKSLTGLLGIGALLVAGASSAATLQLTPSAPTVAVGDTFSLTVNGIDFPTFLFSGNAVVEWDDTELLLLSTGYVDLSDLGTIESTLPTGWGSIAITGPVVNSDSVEVTAGTLGSAFLVGPVFDFFTLEFQALTAGDAEVRLSQSDIWEDQLDGVVDGIQFNDATVQVNAVPVPAAVWLFGSGLIGLVGVARRRKMAL